MILNKKQTIALDFLEDNLTNEIFYGGAAGGGKSILGCYWLLKCSLKYSNSRWLMGRSKLKTLKETTLVSFLKVCQIQGIVSVKHYKINNQSHSIIFPNGSEILMKDLFYYPSDPNFDELGSLEITGAFIDEESQLSEKAHNIVRSRIRHDLDKNNLIPKMLGTTNPCKNFLYSKVYKPYRENKLPKNIRFVPALVTDNPDISKHYIENLEQLDELTRARLLHGDWEYDEDDSRLMNYEKIVDLFVNTHVIQLANKYITADIARKGKDKTVIRVWFGFVSIRKIVLDNSLTTEVCEKIRQLQREYSIPNSNTIVDEDGVGGGVVDALKCKGFLNGSRQVEQPNKTYNYRNLRSQCYHKLSQLVNNNEIWLQNESIKDRENITQELEQIRRINIDKDTTFDVISREEIIKNIGRSPDEASTLMMRMWFEVSKVERKGMRLLS